MPRVVLAMSGGVDSSVAAHLLLEAGHDVIGVFMRHGESSPVACSTEGDLLPIIGSARRDHKQGCCTAADAEDGRRVADQLEIPFYALDLSEDFGRIIDYFVAEYTAARTPNPCMVCNNWVKFGRLFDYAESVGAQYVATGHYARLHRAGEAASGADDAAAEGAADDGAIGLYRGLDASKDQSYVLAGIDRRLLPRMLLPVGDYDKPTIRRMAAGLGLRVADKRDSQEICFVTSGRHEEFIRQRRPDVDTAGRIVTTEGQVVGRHAGIERYTIGQRKGLGVALGEPHYVVRIEADSCDVVIGSEAELDRHELTADRSNWLVPPPSGPFDCLAQIRYNSRAAAARVEALPGGRFSVRFDEAQRGVAPGQAVVCYAGDRVLGGGWIE